MAEAKTPWRWRDRIAALGPIDWEALAQEHPRRHGRKLTLAHIAKLEAARAKARKRKRRAALNALVASRIRHDRGDPRNHSAFALRHRLALALDPEVWRTRAEIRALTGAGVESVKLRLLTMMKAGLVERRERADHRPFKTPRYEHRLTARGEALRREAEWLS